MPFCLIQNENRKEIKQNKKTKQNKTKQTNKKNKKQKTKNKKKKQTKNNKTKPVFKQGEDNDDWFLVYKGEVNVMIETNEVLCSIPEGECFGKNVNGSCTQK